MQLVIMLAFFSLLGTSRLEKAFSEELIQYQLDFEKAVKDLEIKQYSNARNILLRIRESDLTPPLWKNLNQF